MSDKKKIIIDEDWKSQVAAEKEAAAREVHQHEAGEGTAPATGQPIPASFELLVTTFVTEAMVALGQLPHPVTQKLAFDGEHARFAIDMLEVIADKTKGNLAPDEEQGLHEVLHQLRMEFVAISQQAAAPASVDISPAS